MAKILVVDDEAHITHVVALKLRNAGHDVDTAGDGEEGFEAANSGGYDLLVTDIQMPYMTGLELAKKLSKTGATKDLPIIVLTARGYKLDSETIEGTGIRAILSKPFSPREVLSHVQEILDGGRQEAA
jgi:two-component system, OmpR family, alkaline phosphatase synthesis response regulator PhoP